MEKEPALISGFFYFTRNCYICNIMAKSEKKDLGKPGNNITYEINHSLIHSSYVKLIKEFKRKPTIAEVAKDCKLSHNTIDSHIKNLKFDPLKHPLRMLSEDVLIAIMESAKNGSSASQKLWMQIAENWSERTINEIPGIEKISELIITTHKKNGTKSGNKGN